MVRSGMLALTLSFVLSVGVLGAEQADLCLAADMVSGRQPLDGRFFVASLEDDAVAQGTAEGAAESEASEAEKKDDGPGTLYEREGEPGSRLVPFGPYLRFTGPDKAEVRWGTDKAMPSVVEYTVGGELRRAEDPKSTKSHRVDLVGLRRNSPHIYRLVFTDGEAETRSRQYECDTTFNYLLPPVPDRPSPYTEDALTALYMAAADRIVAGLDTRKGYCLVLGCGQGRLAYEVAKRTDFHIIGLDTDADRIAEARQALMKAGVYGHRVNLRQVESFSSLPFPKYFANLIVWDSVILTGSPEGDAKELFRVLRPHGGVAMLGQPVGAPTAIDMARAEAWLRDGAFEPESSEDGGVWLTAGRPPVPGAGEWTHQYGLPDNSARSGESLMGATHTGDLEVQWLGRPGANAMVGRNSRIPAPLYSNGRLLIHGLGRLMMVDAYNGAILWTLEIPGMNRFNMPRDCGNCCMDDEYVYVAVKDACWRLDAATGDLLDVFEVRARSRKSQSEWGYIARAGDALFGSAVMPEAVYREFWGNARWYDSGGGVYTTKVCSDSLFALRKDDGKTLWRYRGGVIINSSIAIAEPSRGLPRRIYFVESRNKKVVDAGKRQGGIKELWEDQFLVALDAASGKTLFERPLNTVDGTVVFYLLHANDTVLVALSQKAYHIYAFDDATGEPRWEGAHEWTGDNHGGHMQHPSVVGNTVYLEPCGYDIATGERVTDGMGRHAGCATYAATDHALVYRGEGGKVSLWDVTSGDVTGWARLRPGCWLTTVAGGGMLLSPEGGGGCSCGQWIETSLAFAPRGG